MGYKDDVKNKAQGVVISFILWVRIGWWKAKRDFEPQELIAQYKI